MDQDHNEHLVCYEMVKDFELTPDMKEDMDGMHDRKRNN